MTAKKLALNDIFVTTGNPVAIQERLSALEGDPESRERIIVGHGPAGRGKTATGIWLAGAAPKRRVYVRARQVWNSLNMLQDLCRALGRLDAPSTTGKAYRELLNLAVETGRTTLIIDESNYLKQVTLNILRDLHDESGLTLLLLGEDKIVEELEKHRRLKSRVWGWLPFAALAEAEAHLVAGKLLPSGMAIELDAAKELLAQAGGVFRDFVTRLRGALRRAAENDQDKISLALVKSADNEPRRLKVAR